MTLHYPELPEGITSFGATVCDGAAYLYGGHCGRAHEYYQAGQSNQLRRIALDQPGVWEELPTGPRLQGLALVSHASQLYRIGGFAARNQQGEPNDLWSVTDCARFDLATGQWEALPALPTPRSSHDAIVVGDQLYVVGGWTLAGEEESSWQTTALVADLNADAFVWRELPTPPFERRALATAAFGGKLYVIGGMQNRGGPTGAVDVFDPATQTWSSGPALDGAADEGFGAAACAVGGSLYVSTVQGHLQRMDLGTNSWSTVQQLPTSRFFHRMLPVGDDRLLIVGGANMDTGRFRQVDVVEVAPA
ncbi:N-acetylneuraminate epimerase [Symmachiella dynata]|uniref:Kelch repeat-containing protein n=1 Tax=Symmachiella dynata TaxID=2527995 RepID=UPI00118AFC89|nr:DUF1668 domain-containing protein [Symmachiella dynata]QDT46892.1 N-acetylneuraminate epimerase [Symmachiella dynata]